MIRLSRRSSKRANTAGLLSPSDGILVSIFGKLTSVYCSAPKEPAGIDIAVTMRPNYPGLKSQKTDRPNCSSRLGSLWAVSDISIMKVLDPNTLEPIGMAYYQTSLHPDLTGSLSCAHSMTDLETGVC